MEHPFLVVMPMTDIFLYSHQSDLCLFNCSVRYLIIYFSIICHAIDEMNKDNRNYYYHEDSVQDRSEYNIIVNLIADQSRVIDLGCGDGSLLKKLVTERRVEGQGLEASATGVAACLKKGLMVEQGNVDQELPYEDNAFDYSICNITIQMLDYPEILLREMKRISTYQIVSFPNFAYFTNRVDLLIHGRMPRPLLFGYSWYNTGHIHQLSGIDFMELIRNIGGFRIVGRTAVPSGHSIVDWLGRLFPNLFQKVIIMTLQKS